MILTHWWPPWGPWHCSHNSAAPQALAAPRLRPRALRVQRQPIERLFSRLEQFRRIATRYDKLEAHFPAFIHLAAIVLWRRDC